MANDNELLMKFIENLVKGLRTEIEAVKTSQENSHAEMMDMIERAFPDGDIQGHQRFHQQLIDDAKTRVEIRKEILKKIAAGSSWSIIVFFGYKLVDWLKGSFDVFSK